MKLSLAVGAVALATLLAIVLFRELPKELRPSPQPPKEATPVPDAKAPLPVRTPIPRPTPGPQAVDEMGIPLNPAVLAEGVTSRAKEHAAVLARLKDPQTPEAERSGLKRQGQLIATELAQWAARLPDHKAWQFKELFAGLYRDDPTFKYEAASYLAALPGDAGHDVLLEGLRGASVHARAAAALALEPYLLQRKDCPDGLRAALRKALSDDLSAVSTDATTYGPGNKSALELAVKLRSVAVKVLLRAQDVEAIPSLLDVETGKDGVGWTTNDPEDVDAVYRLLAKHPPPQLAERLTGVVDAHLTAEATPGKEPPGDPISAALLLEALGRGAKLQELRARTHADFVKMAEKSEEAALGEAQSLLYLHDARAVDWMLDRLTSADAQVRNRALIILNETTGQKLVPSRDLDGEGGATDQPRWAAARQKWADWWTSNREKFQLANPYR